MSTYTPDRWIVLEIKHPDSEPVRKVFAGWYGGFTTGDSWQLNSGITNTRVDYCGHYEFDGQSGSTYYCDANDYGMTSYMRQALESWRKQQPHTEFKEIKLESIEAFVI
jgi:hypothetical protein